MSAPTPTTIAIPKPAVIYLRFSPRRNAEDQQTLMAQEQACRKYAVDHGMDIVAVLSDPYQSARKVRLFDRPEGRRIQELVLAKQIRHVIVSRLDRVFRNAIDGMVTRQWLIKRKVKLHLAHEGGVSLCANDALGSVMFNILVSFNQFLPELIAERTSQTLLAMQRNGRCISSSARFGYTRKGKMVVPNPAERAQIEEIMVMHNNGMGSIDIAKTLRKRKTKCRTRAWDSKIVRTLINRELGIDD